MRLRWGFWTETPCSKTWERPERLERSGRLPTKALSRLAALGAGALADGDAAEQLVGSTVIAKAALGQAHDALGAVIDDPAALAAGLAQRFQMGLSGQNFAVFGLGSIDLSRVDGQG